VYKITIDVDTSSAFNRHKCADTNQPRITATFNNKYD